MMYKDLLELYDKLEPYNVVAPPAHTTITPKIGVLLDPNGNFMGAMYVNETAIVPCTEKSEYRTSGAYPHLIHDNLSYVGNLPGYENRFELYISQLEDYVAHVDDPLARAVCAHAKTGMLLMEIQPIINAIKTALPADKIPVVFAIPGLKTTVSPAWTEYYVKQLPVNGVCSVTNEPAYIPEGYPKNLRKQGDMSKLFQSSSKKMTDGAPICAPGYIASQKICHALQWLTSAPDVTVGNDEGPLYNYIPLKEYAEIHGANPANVRQKILRGTLPAKKIGSEWFIDINTPYTDARRKEGES
jgi:hypothetical protein